MGSSFAGTTRGAAAGATGGGFHWGYWSGGGCAGVVAASEGVVVGTAAGCGADEVGGEDTGGQHEHAAAAVSAAPWPGWRGWLRDQEERWRHQHGMLLERALEASGDDLDSAIRSLNDLRLESAEAILSAAVCESENGLSTLKSTAVGGVSNGHLDGNSPRAGNCQTNHLSSEWVDLFVREMTSASDINDARARASRALEVIEKSNLGRVGPEAAQNLFKENVMLKEQLAIILRENAVLKRGVAIQHERQKELDDRTQEVQNLKQLALQYQEQLKTLEINNYALRVHLQQAQQNSSMPGGFHPDVF